MLDFKSFEGRLDAHAEVLEKTHARLTILETQINMMRLIMEGLVDDYRGRSDKQVLHPSERCGQDDDTAGNEVQGDKQN
jgi:hypothetical protein